VKATLAAIAVVPSKRGAVMKPKLRSGGFANDSVMAFVIEHYIRLLDYGTFRPVV
jgi:hypothetical protein